MLRSVYLPDSRVGYDLFWERKGEEWQGKEKKFHYYYLKFQRKNNGHLDAIPGDRKT